MANLVGRHPLERRRARRRDRFARRRRLVRQATTRCRSSPTPTSGSTAGSHTGAGCRSSSRPPDSQTGAGQPTRRGRWTFAAHRFLGTAVRTWKRWLWDHLRDDDLRDESGEYVRVSEDKLVMIPLLEMCGTSRAHHIDTPIMIYNKIVDYAIGDLFAEERVRNAALDRSAARPTRGSLPKRTPSRTPWHADRRSAAIRPAGRAAERGSRPSPSHGHRRRARPTL